MIQDHRRRVDFGRELPNPFWNQPEEIYKKEDIAFPLFVLSASMYASARSGSYGAAGVCHHNTACLCFVGMKEQLSSIRLCTSAGRRALIVSNSTSRPGLARGAGAERARPCCGSDPLTVGKVGEIPLGTAATCTQLGSLL